MEHALLTTPEAASRLGITAKTLKIWRAKGKGPTPTRLAQNVVRYTEEALASFVASKSTPNTPTSTGGQ